MTRIGTSDLDVLPLSLGGNVFGWTADRDTSFAVLDAFVDGGGDFINIGGNMMVCADPATGETRRFLTGPNKCEVTGVTMTPDGKTMFVGVQHPGEDATFSNPTAFSSWPQSQWTVAADGVTPLPAGRPRSAVVVITKDDGGLVGL